MALLTCVHTPFPPPQAQALARLIASPEFLRTSCLDAGLSEHLSDVRVLGTRKDGSFFHCEECTPPGCPPDVCVYFTTLYKVELGWAVVRWTANHPEIPSFRVAQNPRRTRVWILRQEGNDTDVTVATHSGFPSQQSLHSLVSKTHINNDMLTPGRRTSSFPYSSRLGNVKDRSPPTQQQQPRFSSAVGEPGIEFASALCTFLLSPAGQRDLLRFSGDPATDADEAPSRPPPPPSQAPGRKRWPLNTHHASEDACACYR